MIPDSVIDEIRSRADIVAVIGEHVQLRKAGQSYKGLCPFHGEKTPSFNVVPAKGFFYCFGCRKRGDVFTFVMELQGKSFTEAAEQLAARCGIQIAREEENPELRRARGERIAMQELNKLATAFFREILADPKRGAPGRAYLDKRGVDAATRDRFQLGYAPGDWHALVDHLKAKRADLEIAARLGLVAPQPRAGGHYDRYRERLVCPVIVPGGDVAGFSARVVEGVPGLGEKPDRDPPPKYFNSPESAVYKKSKLLYGLAQAREAMAQGPRRAVLVEGNFDVISMHQAGFTEVVAPLGTALTAEQIDLLRRLTERVVLFYDGDRAGYAATLNALQLCADADLEVRVVQLERGLDPDSAVRTGGAERVRTLLDRARDGIEFFAFEVWARAKGNPAALGRALDDAARLLAKVRNPTHRELLLGQLATALEVDRKVIDAALHRAVRAAATRPTAPPSADHRHPNAPGAPGHETTRATPQVGAPPPTDELELLALLTDHPDLVSTAEADKAFSLLTDARLRDICSAARAGTSLVELTTSPDSGLPAASATLVLSGKYAAETDPASRLAAMAANLHRRGVQAGPGRKGATMADYQARLAEAQRKGDHELARQLVSEIVSTRNKKVD
jgi:DNA primase